MKTTQKIRLIKKLNTIQTLLEKCGGEGGTPGPCPSGGGKPGGGGKISHPKEYNDAYTFSRVTSNQKAVGSKSIKGLLEGVDLGKTKPMGGYGKGLFTTKDPKSLISDLKKKGWEHDAFLKDPSGGVGKVSRIDSLVKGNLRVLIEPPMVAMGNKSIPTSVQVYKDMTESEQTDASISHSNNWRNRI